MMSCLVIVNAHGHHWDRRCCLSKWHIRTHTTCCSPLTHNCSWPHTHTSKTKLISFQKYRQTYTFNVDPVTYIVWFEYLVNWACLHLTDSCCSSALRCGQRCGGQRAWPGTLPWSGYWVCSVALSIWRGWDSTTKGKVWGPHPSTPDSRYHVITNTPALTRSNCHFPCEII